MSRHAFPGQHHGRALVAVGVTLALLLALAQRARDHPAPAVHVSGNRLTDATGRTLRLLGVNRSGAEYACIQGLGFFAGPTDRRAIAAMAAWGVNTVRLPLNEHCWLGINGVPARYSGARYRAAVAAYVRRLHAAGLYVVLDLHWNAPGGQRAAGQQPMADLDHAPAFWSSVARTFRDDPALVFDLYNEPHGITWACWRDGCLLPEGWRTAGMQQLVDAVRATGARQPIIAAGLHWAANLTGWSRHRPNDPAKQLVAGFHVFDFTGCSDPGCWAGTLQPLARLVPVVTTEIGERACGGAFVDRYASWADRSGVSYLGWAWNPAGCGAPSLINSWSGEPTAPGAHLRARLLRLRDAPRF